MNKKPYQPPTIKKVELEVKSSVLAVCRTSFYSGWNGWGSTCKDWSALCANPIWP